MEDVFLTLRDVIFMASEIVHPIAAGRVEVDGRRIVGGTDIVMPLGSEHLQIEWAGVLGGPTARNRANALVDLAQVNARVPLSCNGHICNVCLTLFEADLDRPGDIRYQVRCAPEHPSDPIDIAAIAALASASQAQKALADLARVLARQAAHEASASPEIPTEKEDGK